VLGSWVVIRDTVAWVSRSNAKMITSLSAQFMDSLTLDLYTGTWNQEEARDIFLSGEVKLPRHSRRLGA